MRIQRLKSRKRQKDQNAKAGIRLVTDMTRFRKGPQHAVQLVKPAPGPHSSHPATGKFSDASALRALEGSPNVGSVGNWAWLKNSPSTASVSTFQGDTTPDSSKIVIGISLPEDDAARKDISPQTAVVATPFDRLPLNNKPSTNPFHNQQVKSAWSPDTEDSFSPARHLNSMSGVYSQATSATPGQPGVPPVPALPSSLKNPAKARLSRNDLDDDDDDSTPVTLFEEDGHKTPASATSKLSPGAMTAASARSGWWDHLTTPFRERFSPTSKSDKEAPSPAADEWWKGQDEKKSMGAVHIEDHPAYSASGSSATLRPYPSPVPIIRVPTPTIASSSSSGVSTLAPSHECESRSEKARAMMDEGDHDAPTEMPPPYERTPSTKQTKPVRFRAVFPPGHELANAYPPSPQPGSPGLDGTMSSQGAIKMSDVPLTPAIGTSAPLPERKAGTYVTGDHFLANYGNDPAAKIERTRRRHEKEDYVAHKAGGFWRGRGCVPESGCYGRSGREGRQRRRVWIGAICLAVLLLTTLGVVLGVVLSRRVARGPAAGGDTTPTAGGSTGGSEIENIWLNLTDFPPMPTGLSTIVAPDNSQIINGCAAPSTLWSCSLPPEQQAANEPHDADQPGFIFQIQYDNNTRQLWNMPNGTPPTPTQPKASTSSKASTSGSASTTSASASASATNSIQGGDLSNPSSSTEKRATALYDTGIAPNPDPPSFQEMWFLGNTTDGIVSDDKAGEPTPFYISFFTNTSGSAGPNMLRSSDDKTSGAERRGIGNGIGSGSDSTGSLSDLLPPPPLNADGTGAPAQLRPYPFQQPLRLFDRGLPTEHYGFYSYFNKTIYVTSMDDGGNDTTTSSEPPVAADAGGGSRESAARFLVSWTQTRFVVKIWTRRGGASRLMGGSGGPVPAADVDDLAAMPGTFPYPVTVGEDTHGGSVDLKATFAYGVEPDRHVNMSDPTLFTNDVSFGGSAVNPRLPNGDLSWGGVDGGTGGCRCEWVNWVAA